MIPCLESALSRFRSLKNLGDRTLKQVSTLEDFQWAPDSETNSIGVIVQHLHGNMMSRWTDFLTMDGEKDWRDRDGEFTVSDKRTREEYLELWEEGWAVTLDTLESLKPEDLSREVRIRNRPLSVIDAIHRQLSHYSYHVGQIVLLARIRRSSAWNTLTIAKGMSKQYVPGKTD